MAGSRRKNGRLARRPGTLAESVPATLTGIFERLECLFRDGLQFCSGLVDLVVCVRDYGSGRHPFALTGERFVGLVAEHIAEVGDRSADFRDRRRGGGTERETCDGGRWFAASEPVEEGGEHR